MSGSVTQAAESSSARPRTLSHAGVAAMAVGLSIVALEVYTRFIESRLGAVGHFVVVGCGVYFSIWGLKEIIAGLLPRLGPAALGRDHFVFPTEGMVYVVIMGAIFAGAMIGRSNPLLLVFSLMAGPLIVNGWLTKTLLHRVSAQRRAPARVMAGEPVSVEIALTNGKRWLSAWLLTVVDRVASPREELRPQTVFPRVPPGGACVSHYRLQLMQRGVYALGPLQVNTRFPLGLVERGVNFNLPERLLVYPRLGRLTNGWKAQVRQASELAVEQLAQGGAFNDEFHQLRDYRHGDDHRAIHWKTSARQKELMVREFRQHRDQDLLLLLDAWLPEHAGTEDRLAVEQAVSLAATVAVDQCRQGRDAVPFVAAGGREAFTWGGAEGSHRLEALLDGLAVLEPAAHVALPELLEHCRRHLGPHQRLLLITPRPESVRRQVDEWAAARPQQRSRLVRSLDLWDPHDARLAHLVAWT